MTIKYLFIILFYFILFYFYFYFFFIYFDKIWAPLQILLLRLSLWHSLWGLELDDKASRLLCRGSYGQANCIKSSYCSFSSVLQAASEPHRHCTGVYNMMLFTGRCSVLCEKTGQNQYVAVNIDIVADPHK